MRSPLPTAVFLHGAGRAGRDAWPLQSAAASSNWVFLDRHEQGDDGARDAMRVLDALRVTSGGHIVAASYGGVAGVLAAQTEPELVKSLVLFEPACFDLARGNPAVEEHLAAMTPVFAAASDPAVSFREYSRLFAEAMGRTPALDVADDVLEPEVARLRVLPPPWGTALRADLVCTVPTLVVTGGESPLFDAVAEALVARGAEHVVVPGHGHRPQDATGANELLQRFWSRA